MNKKQVTPTTFAAFGLSAEVEAGVRDAGFEIPSSIQSEVIPLILEGRDVIAQSETGTGKTAAFGLPIMSRFLPAESAVILVIVPTRELALQVSNELCMLGKHAGAKAAVVYGGASARDQISKIAKGATIVTGTPGRILDLLSSGRIELEPSVVVLDEADRMLDMGFLEDIEKIFAHLPEERQTLLFSATLPERIQKLAGRILDNPARVKTATTQTAPKIAQSFCIVSEHEREPALLRFFDFDPPERAIVFCRTKRETDELTGRLISRGVEARAIHGDMDQKHREQVLGKFRAGKIRTLIATDVAARGLDVPGVTHVFNYHIPFDKDSYTHRIGRTGRAGTEGRSITFVAPGEMFRWMRMARDTGDAEFLRVPTLTELREKRQEDLVTSIQSTVPSDTSTRLFDLLSDETDQTSLILRLLTLLEAKLPMEGPEFIGKEKFQPQEKQGGKDRGAGRRRSGRNRYGDRSDRRFDRDDDEGADAHRRRDFGGLAEASGENFQSQSKGDRSERRERPDRGERRPYGQRSDREVRHGAERGPAHAKSAYPAKKKHVGVKPPFGGGKKKKFKGASTHTPTPSSGGAKKKAFGSGKKKKKDHKKRRSF